MDVSTVITDASGMQPVEQTTPPRRSPGAHRHKTLTGFSPQSPDTAELAPAGVPEPEPKLRWNSVVPPDPPTVGTLGTSASTPPHQHQPLAQSDLHNGSSDGSAAQPVEVPTPPQRSPIPRRKTLTGFSPKSSDSEDFSFSGVPEPEPKLQWNSVMPPDPPTVGTICTSSPINSLDTISMLETPQSDSNTGPSELPAESSPTPYNCAVCGKTNAKKRCGRCKAKWYCDVECQKHDWVNQHSQLCNSFGAVAMGLTVGMRVEARYQGGAQLFPAKIACINEDGTANLLYDDGDGENCVPALRIKQPGQKQKKNLEKGTEVECRCATWGDKYMHGRVLNCHRVPVSADPNPEGEETPDSGAPLWTFEYDVRFDHGLVERRIPRKYMFAAYTFPPPELPTVVPPVLGTNQPEVITAKTMKGGNVKAHKKISFPHKIEGRSLTCPITGQTAESDQRLENVEPGMCPFSGEKPPRGMYEDESDEEDTMESLKKLAEKMGDDGTGGCSFAAMAKKEDEAAKCPFSADNQGDDRYSPLEFRKLIMDGEAEIAEIIGDPDRGLDHPDEAAVHHRLCDVYIKQDKAKPAIKHAERALQILEGAYANEEPVEDEEDIDLEEQTKAQATILAKAYDKIGKAYYADNQDGPAMKWFQKGLELRRSELGKDHPSLGASYINIGNVHQYRTDPGRAIEYYEMSLDVRKAAYGGDNHPDVGISYFSLATAYEYTSDFENAIECYKNCVEIWKKTLGEDHELTKKAMKSLDQSLTDREQCIIS